MTEPQPGGTGPTSVATRDSLDAPDDLFLTPRVVDRRAFEEYSALLQGLIREAAGQGKSLRAAADDVRGIESNLKEATGDLQSRLENALKILPQLEQRVARAEQLLKLAVDRRELVDQVNSQVSGQLRSMVDERLGRLKLEIAALVDASIKRSEQTQADSAHRSAELAETANAAAEEASRSAQVRIEQAVTQAVNRLTEAGRAAQARVDELISTVDAKLADAGREIETTLARTLASSGGAGAIDAMARAAADRIAELRSETDTRVRELIDQSRVILTTAETEARGTMDRLAQEFRQNLDSARTQAEGDAAESLEGQSAAAQARLADRLRESDAEVDAMLTRLDDRLRPVHEWATSMVSEVEQRLEKWKARSAVLARLDPDRLEQLLTRPHTITDDSSAKIQEQLDRLAALQAQAERALAQADDLRAKAEQTRSRFADAVLSGAAAADEMDKSLEAASARHEALLERVRQAEARAASAEKALRELTQEIDAPLPTMHAARQQLEAMSAWISQTAAGVQESGRHVTALVSQAQESGRSLARMLAMLEPWRPLLLNQDPKAELPAPLQALVRRLASETERARK